MGNGEKGKRKLVTFNTPNLVYNIYMPWHRCKIPNSFYAS